MTVGPRSIVHLNETKHLLDDRAEDDQRAEQRLHEDVDHRPAPDEAHDVEEPGAVAQLSRPPALGRDKHDREPASLSRD